MCLVTREARSTYSRKPFLIRDSTFTRLSRPYMNAPLIHLITRRDFLSFLSDTNFCLEFHSLVRLFDSVFLHASKDGIVTAILQFLKKISLNLSPVSEDSQIPIRESRKRGMNRSVVVPSMDARDRGENHADKARRWSPPSGPLPRAYHRGLMVRVARVFHKHLSWRGGAAPPWKVIPVYICATSIWTYDGNNLEALAARRTCAAAGSRSLHGATLDTGGSCAQGASNRSQERIRCRVCHAGGS